MCLLLQNNQVGISGNMIHFLTCFVRILARNSVNPTVKLPDSLPCLRLVQQPTMLSENLKPVSRSEIF